MEDLEQKLLLKFKETIQIKNEKLEIKIHSLKNKWTKDYNKLNCNPRFKQKEFAQLEISDFLGDLDSSDFFESESDQEFIQRSSFSRKSQLRKFLESEAQKLDAKGPSNLIQFKDFEFVVKNQMELKEKHVKFLKMEVFKNKNPQFKSIFSELDKNIKFKKLIRQYKNKNLLFLFLTHKNKKFGAKLCLKKDSLENSFIFQISKKIICPIKPDKINNLLKFDKTKGLIFGNEDLIIGNEPLKPNSCECHLGNAFFIDPSKHRDSDYGTNQFYLKSFLVYEIFE